MKNKKPLPTKASPHSFEYRYSRYRTHDAHKKKPKVLMEGQALFQGVLEKLGYNPANYAVFEMWDTLMGPMAAQVRALGLKGDCLCVEVESSAHLHDITLRKRGLLKKLNGYFGTERPISDIILQLAPATKRSTGQRGPLR